MNYSEWRVIRELAQTGTPGETDVGGCLVGMIYFVTFLLMLFGLVLAIVAPNGFPGLVIAIVSGSALFLLPRWYRS
jgi:hypothetical protein